MLCRVLKFQNEVQVRHPESLVSSASQDPKNSQSNPNFNMDTDSNPLSPTTIRRSRNVQLNSGISSRSDLVGASLSEETVRHMRGILDQIGAVDSRSVYDSHDESTYTDDRTHTDEHTYADDRTYTDERMYTDGRMYSGVSGGREQDRLSMGENRNRDRQYHRVYGAVGQHSDDRRNKDEMSHRSNGTHYYEMHDDEGGHYENPGVPLDNQRRLVSAEKEINLLNSTLQSERRVNDALTAQLSDLMNSDTFSPLGGDQEEGEGGTVEECTAQGSGSGFRGGNVGSAGPGSGGGGGRVEDLPGGEKDVSQLPSNTAHKTYSSFMRETEMEFTLPDGEGGLCW